MMEYSLKSGEILNIREAVPEDAAGFLSYMIKIGAESDNLLFGEGDVDMTEAQEREFLQKQRDTPDSVMFLGELNGEIVCSAQVGRQGGSSRTTHRGGMAIAVLKDHWNKGVGTCMMQEIISFARSLGIEQLELEVKSDNENAIALYRKTGFRKTGEIPRYFRYTPNRYADADIMICPLI